MINKLTIQGFGPFRKSVTLNFSQGIYYIYGENLDQPVLAPSNGSGKTSILNAICVALYGQTPKGAKKKQLINHNSDEYVIELWTEKLRVKRSMHRKGSEELEFDYGSKPYTGGVSELQPTLEEYLGMDFAAFCNICFLSGDSKASEFLSATSGDRMKILQAFIDTLDFEAGAERIKDDMDELEIKKSKAEWTLQEMAERVPILRHKLEQAEERLAQFEESERERTKDIKDKIREYKGHMVDTLNSMKGLDTSGSFGTYEDQKIQYTKKLQTSNSALAVLKHEYKKLVDQDTDDHGRCPQCYQALSPQSKEAKEQRINELRTEIRALAEETDIYAKKAQEASEGITRLRSNQERLKKLEADLAYYKQQIALLTDDLQTPSTHYLEETARSLLEDIEDCKRREEEAKKVLHYLSTHIPFLRSLKSYFQQDVPNMLLDKLRYVLQTYTNNYIRILADNEFKIEFPVPKSVKRDKFHVSMISGGNKQAIENYSGAETWKARIACMLALRRYSIDVNAIDIDWLLIDDPAGELDAGGLEQFVNMIGKLLDDTHTRQIMVTLPVRVEDENGKTIQVQRKDREAKAFFG